MKFINKTFFIVGLLAIGSNAFGADAKAKANVGYCASVGNFLTQSPWCGGTIYTLLGGAAVTKYLYETNEAFRTKFQALTKSAKDKASKLCESANSFLESKVQAKGKHFVGGFGAAALAVLGYKFDVHGKAYKVVTDRNNSSYFGAGIYATALGGAYLWRDKIFKALGLNLASTNSSAAVKASSTPAQPRIRRVNEVDVDVTGL